MRFFIGVHLKNYLLFACEFVNMGAQLTQASRYINPHYLGEASSNTDQAAGGNIKGAPHE